jgi:DNA-binding MarR family transcriptional regulator
MLDLKKLLALHLELVFQRRQSIADYWDENQEDDLIARLTLRQINYLVTIKRYGPCSIHTIMQYTGLSSSAASAAVDKLVKAGVVDRVQNRDNRREVLVSLTPKIRYHMEQINERFLERIAEILADCSSEEEKAINRSTEILNRKFMETA